MFEYYIIYTCDGVKYYIYNDVTNVYSEIH